ncbi:hypothetical protein [Nocardiopsis aegyptia]|uniref:Uncharacterized protein n=1 Tax=Nocardiopsis aegyptia TaxID=220378 RepID=A0A7Z0ES99_9ACTN|nr:hypothetical protein [Nocardiopsis aegyptia]NYJ37385.1 hypothetical protein [Nocardiopsis aegyptia]
MDDAHAVKQGPLRASRVMLAPARPAAAVSRSTSVVPEAPRTGLRALHGHG